MTTQKSLLQLNLFVPQPDPLTKEQLFSEDKKKEMQGILSDEKYNFYKEHTRFVSYQELLGKLTQIKDWLNENITDWNSTAFFSSYHGNSSSRIAQHFCSTGKKKINYIKYNSLEDNHKKAINKYNTFIIIDDASYSGKQINNQIGVLLENIDNYSEPIKIIIAIPYMSYRAWRKLNNYDIIKVINKNIKLILLNDITEKVNMIYEQNNSRLLIDQNYQGEPHCDSRTLLVFEHKRSDPVSLPPVLLTMTRPINPPYDK